MQEKGEIYPDCTNFGAPRAQQDVMDLVHYMVSHYPVDRSRIYLVGCPWAA